MSCVSGIHDRLMSLVLKPADLRHRLAMRHQVGMRQHHALGVAGGAGGELDEGDVFGLRGVHDAGLRAVGQILGQEGARAQRREGSRRHRHRRSARRTGRRAPASCGR